MTERPKMCPSCGKLMGIERICPFCGADSKALGVRARSLADRSSSGGGHVVTFGLVTVNLLLYLAVAMIGGQSPAEGGFEFLVPDMDVVQGFGSQMVGRVAAGEWWRLVMPIFLHLGVVHVIMNSLILWLTGRHLEADIGGAAFFVVYIAAGILGFVASQYAGAGGAGASGAVAGVLGCTVVKRRLSDGNFRHPATMMVIQLIVLNAVLGMFMKDVNHVAHLGGLLTGAGLAVPLALWSRKRAAARAWFAGAIAMAGVVVAAAVMTALTPIPSAGGELKRIVDCYNLSVEALDQVNQTVVPGPALTAAECFERLDTVEEDVAPHVAAITAGLRSARFGRLDGSRRDEIRGVAEVRRGLAGLNRWFEVVAPGMFRDDSAP